jgi:hypothetical protein
MKFEDWRSTPHIKNRFATKEDIDLGKAIFVIDPKTKQNNHNLVDIEIPFLAYLIENDVKKVIIGIQTEESNGQKIVGYRTFDDEIGACTFDEIKIIDEDEAKKNL